MASADEIIKNEIELRRQSEAEKPTACASSAGAEKPAEDSYCGEGVRECGAHLCRPQQPEEYVGYGAPGRGVVEGRSVVGGFPRRFAYAGRTLGEL